MSKFRYILRILRSLPASICFNFRHLPLKQAMHLPILLYRPHIGVFKGNLRICGPVSFGMIHLGFHSVSLYPSRGIRLECLGGDITFSGRCFVGSGSAISVGPKGRLAFGNKVMANAEVKIVAYHNISIGDNVRIGWENMLLDTDMHALTHSDGSLAHGYGPVHIGENCWLGTGCLVLKNSWLPPFTTVQARTIVAKRFDIAPKSVIGPDTHAVVKASDTYRDLSNDNISYPDKVD